MKTISETLVQHAKNYSVEPEAKAAAYIQLTLTCDKTGDQAKLGHISIPLMENNELTKVLLQLAQHPDGMEALKQALTINIVKPNPVY